MHLQVRVEKVVPSSPVPLTTDSPRRTPRSVQPASFPCPSRRAVTLRLVRWIETPRERRRSARRYAIWLLIALVTAAGMLGYSILELGGF